MSSDPTEDTIDYIPPQGTAESPQPRPAAEKARVEVAALSHAGIVRPRNEDVYLVARIVRSLQTVHTNMPDGSIPDRHGEEGYGLLVADGVGGTSGGDVASQTAVTTLIRLVIETPAWIMRLGDREPDEVMERTLRRYRAIDEELRAQGATSPDLIGMGTTMTVAHNIGRSLFLGHIGDSRAYLCRADGFHQITRDHTYAQEMADLGVIRPDEVATHQFRNVLTRALGGLGQRVDADVLRLLLSEGDQMLLCTDGLTDMVGDDDICAILRRAATAHEACRQLVELALDHGGKDNVTAVLARYSFVREQ
jgi:PPM family protein phosphatase